MKKRFLLLILGLVFVMVMGGCSVSNELSVIRPRLPQVAQEDDVIVIDDTDRIGDDISLMYKGGTHDALTLDAAKFWNLATARQNNMADASRMPDTYQAGIDTAFNQQWSHAYLYSSLDIWIWGDADDDFYDNLNQSGGELESPEGYNGKSAKYYYNNNNQKQGDWYLGYACHYIEDAALLLHATDPTTDMLSHHGDFESWIANNWTSGHKFANAVANDTSYYTVSSPKDSLKAAAKACSYWTSTLGKTIWDNYKASGYPTAASTGNSTLVTNTKTMLIRAARYTRGTIKYALDTYGEWTYSGYIY